MAAVEEWLSRLQERLSLREGMTSPGTARVLYQFRFDRGEPLYLTVDGAHFQFVPGEDSHPDITLLLDRHATLEELLTGTLGGMDAFMQGRYRSDGNIILSQQLLVQFVAAPAR